MTETVILPCNVNDCPVFVTAEYDPGEPMTRNHPGSPDWWYPYKHGTEDEHPHLDYLDGRDRNDTFQARCSWIAETSWCQDRMEWAPDWLYDSEYNELAF